MGRRGARRAATHPPDTLLRSAVAPYLGFVLQIRGTVDHEARDFTVGIGPTAQATHDVHAGHTVTGFAEPVVHPQLESCEFYKVSGLRVVSVREVGDATPPWRGRPPGLAVYRARGHRRLDARTYTTHCRPCVWGCRMPVELIVDQWNPQRRQFRVETFCYGPKSCPLYRAGPTRQVPGRRGMRWTEEDWIDDEATAHRGPDE